MEKTMLDNISDEQLEDMIAEESEYNSKVDVDVYNNDEYAVISSFDLKEQVKAKGVAPTYKSDLQKLNRLNDGFKEGEVIVVSGITGEGKTTFCETLTRGLFENGTKALWLSFEVNQEDFIGRFGDDVPFFAIPKKHKQSSSEWVEQKIYEAIGKFGVKVVFIDHLHFLMSLDMLYKAKSTSLAIGMEMRNLKRIALETRTVIFLIAHVTKTSFDSEPSLSDIRDSSFIAQEADQVLMVWRKRDNDGNYDENKSFVRVLKNRRKGKTGAVEMVLVNGRLREAETAYGMFISR